MLERIERFVDRRFTAVVVAVMLFLGLWAWTHRFIQDDAFISFRYARNLVEGKGLVWNPGERVEGYTNFLWTLLMAVPFALGLDPVRFAHGCGLLLFLASLGAAYGLARSVLGSRYQALLAVVLLGSNYTFSCYATGGLETQLQAALLTALTWLVLSLPREGGWKRGVLAACSLLAALALLTRLDSAVFLAVLYACLGLRMRARRLSLRHGLSEGAFLVLPALVITAAWFAWKWAYYGGILPNTYYAKAAPLSFPANVLILLFGLKYLYFFLLSYGLMPFLFLALFSWKELLGRVETVVPAALLVLWSLYVVFVGGGFMEYRMMVAALPPAVVLIVWLCFNVTARRPVRAALAAVVIFGSLSHAGTFGRTFQAPGVETIDVLEGHLYGPGREWCRVGRVLGALFHDEAHPVVIATTAAGAIPFYSRLVTVDMLGLNDPWVARHGRFAGIRPGHRKIAATAYLVRRKVDLVLGNPVLVPAETALPPAFGIRDLKRFGLVDADPASIPPGARVVEIPVTPDHKLIALNLVRKPFSDAVIRRKGFKTHPVGR